MGDIWDAGQYLRFGGERSRPFFDLIAQVGAADPRYVADLGCGPGNLTAALAERWPQAPQPPPSRPAPHPSVAPSS